MTFSGSQTTIDLAPNLSTPAQIGKAMKRRNRRIRTLSIRNTAQGDIRIRVARYEQGQIMYSIDLGILRLRDGSLLLAGEL